MNNNLEQREKEKGIYSHLKIDIRFEDMCHNPRYWLKLTKDDMVTEHIFFHKPKQ